MWHAEEAAILDENAGSWLLLSAPREKTARVLFGIWDSTQGRGTVTKASLLAVLCVLVAPF
jgi:hypothetical protein